MCNKYKDTNKQYNWKNWTECSLSSNSEHSSTGNHDIFLLIFRASNNKWKPYWSEKWKLEDELDKNCLKSQLFFSLVFFLFYFFWGGGGESESAICPSTGSFFALTVIPLTPQDHWEHCEGHVFWLYQCRQHNTAITSQGEAKRSGSWLSPDRVDHQLPHQQSTVCEASWLFVWCGFLQHSGPTGHSALSFHYVCLYEIA